MAERNTENPNFAEPTRRDEFDEQSFTAHIPRGVYESVAAATDTTGMTVEEFVV